MQPGNRPKPWFYKSNDVLDTPVLVDINKSCTHLPSVYSGGGGGDGNINKKMDDDCCDSYDHVDDHCDPHDHCHHHHHCPAESGDDAGGRWWPDPQYNDLGSARQPIWPSTSSARESKRRPPASTAAPLIKPEAETDDQSCKVRTHSRT